jgi:hypothetical protein
MIISINMDMFYRWHPRKSARRENMYYESLQATSSEKITNFLNLSTREYISYFSHHRPLLSITNGSEK